MWSWKRQTSGQLKTMPTAVEMLESRRPTAVVPPLITNDELGEMRLRVSAQVDELHQVIFTCSEGFIRQPASEQFVSQPDPYRSQTR